VIRPIDPSGKPSRTLGLRATDDERAAWQRAADASGISLKNWARRSLNQVAAARRREITRTKRSKAKP